MLNCIEIYFLRNHSCKKLIFLGLKGPPRDTHISGPKPKLKRLDIPKIGIHAEFKPIPTGSLFCEGYGFKKSLHHFQIQIANTENQ